MLDCHGSANLAGFCDVPSKSHVIAMGDNLQPTPSFAVFLAWLDLDGLKSRIRVEEGLRQIRPERITVEVRGAKPILGVSFWYPLKAPQGFSRVSIGSPDTVSSTTLSGEKQKRRAH
jgi:hypothetical protein